MYAAVSRSTAFLVHVCFVGVFDSLWKPRTPLREQDAHTSLLPAFGLPVKQSKGGADLVNFDRDLVGGCCRPKEGKKKKSEVDTELKSKHIL